MNITSLPKDEMASHLAEVISTQDSRISSLYQERKALLIILAIITTYNLIF